MAQPADIYDFIVRQGTPSKLPGPWGVFQCDPAFFNLEVAPETLLRRLRSEFESDDETAQSNSTTFGSMRCPCRSPICYFWLAPRPLASGRCLRSKVRVWLR